MSSIRRLLLCPEEMELGHLGALVKGVAGWVEPGRGPAPVEIVSAQVAVLGFLIKEELLAIALTAPSVARRW